MSMLIILLGALFALALFVFVSLTRAVRDEFRPTPVQKRSQPARNTAPDLFVPLDPSQKAFPRGTRVD